MYMMGYKFGWVDQRWVINTDDCNDVFLTCKSGLTLLSKFITMRFAEDEYRALILSSFRFEGNILYYKDSVSIYGVDDHSLWIGGIEPHKGVWIVYMSLGGKRFWLFLDIATFGYLGVYSKSFKVESSKFLAQILLSAGERLV